MSIIDLLGIDIAKNGSQLHGADRRRRAVFQRPRIQDQLLGVPGNLEPCTIAIEACTGTLCWARKSEALGHRVKIVSPQCVKPFVRGQK